MDKKFKIAVVILFIVLLWIILGYVLPGEKKDQTAQVSKQTEEMSQKLTQVRIKQSIARKREKNISLIGTTRASKVLEVKSEISGKVDKILAEEGQPIKKGEVILIIEKRNRQAKLDELEARYEQKKISYDSSKRLSASGLQSKTRLAQAKSEMEAARADLIQVQIDFGNTVIKAPFSGILEKINVEEGDFLQVGFGGGSSNVESGFGSEAIAIIIDNSPYLVEASVSERMMNQIKLGSDAKIQLVDNTEAKGEVTYISKIADPKTRSFMVEVTVDDGSMAPSGLTATAIINVGYEMAHKVPSSSLSLDSEGRFGVKYLDIKGHSNLKNNNIGNVRFKPITVYDSDIDGMWITGLDEKIDLIILGGAFVEIGAKVEGIYKNQQESEIESDLSEDNEIVNAPIYSENPNTENQDSGVQDSIGEDE